MTTDKNQLRAIVKDRLSEIVALINSALVGGKDLCVLEPVLKRLGRGRQLPHWYEQLKTGGTLPNLDGKSLGSVLEMVFEVFPKCNDGIDQRCDGTFLPIAHPYGGQENTLMLIWKCTKCGRTIDQHSPKKPVKREGG